MQYGGFIAATALLCVMLFLAAWCSFANKDCIDHGLEPSRRTEHWMFFFLGMAYVVPLMVVELYTGVSVMGYLNWWSFISWIAGVSLLFWGCRLFIAFMVRTSNSFIHE